MRIIVTSDVHRRTSTLLDIIERHYDTTDLFINLGDSENEVDMALMSYPNLKIERVSGNCDWGSHYPTTKIIEAAGKKILICHGHTFYVKHGYQALHQRAKELGVDICLFGHTHSELTEIIDGIHYMNPGAVCEYTYGIIDIEPSGIMMYNQKI